MRTATCLMLGVSALAIAGCTNLPGSSLGATFGAERYLGGEHGGADFNGALAAEYTELGRRAAFEDTLWLNSTAYIAKAQQAEAGVTPAPWMPSELGVSPPSDTGTAGEMALVYDELVRVINANKDARPAACARMQAMWDQYLEALRGEEAGSKFCISVEDARAMLREAAIACRPATESGFVVYFGFNETNLTNAARDTIDAVVAAVSVLGAEALSVVGHTDTVGSLEYNQGLSESRTARVAKALEARGVPAGAMTLAGRSWSDPAVETGPNVREPLNRRVEVVLSD